MNFKREWTMKARKFGTTKINAGELVEVLADVPDEAVVSIRTSSTTSGIWAEVTAEWEGMPPETDVSTHIFETVSGEKFAFRGQPRRRGTYAPYPHAGEMSTGVSETASGDLQ